MEREQRQVRESDRLGFPLYHHGKFSCENKQGTSRADLTDNSARGTDASQAHVTEPSDRAGMR